MIEKDTIAHIKSTVDLKALIESRGIELKKKGKSYVGLCPFHDDTHPSLSVTPSKNEWHCFGCDKGGDVIRFVELIDGVDFKEAVGRLAGDPSDTPKPVSSPTAQQYLERVIAVYENTFAQNSEGKAYLESRGLTDTGLLARHRAGFCNGTLHEILPGNGDVRDTLTRLGILLENGSERFLNCVVFPVLGTDGGVVTLYGRHIQSKKHLFLPNRPTGLWNSPVMKTCPDIILTESVIDALSVHTAGFANVMAIQGTNGLTGREIMELKIQGVQKITLLLDGDEPGIKAAGRLKEKLSGFTVDARTLPAGHDPNSFLTAKDAQKLAGLIRAPAENDTGSMQPSANGFTVSCGIRQYQVMGLDKGPNKLKATIRIEHAGRLHVDTLDLYGARARKALASDLCRILEQTPETIESDITRIIQACETRDLSQKDPATPSIAMTDKDKEEARQFGESKEMMEIILKDFVTCGLIGEDANKLLGYIAMTSRKQNTPISMQILSSSGAGKTALQDAIVNFCPPEDLVKLTSLSGKALFYKEQTSLKHKVLALEEGAGAEDASYAIRSLISAGVLVNETTIKDLATGRLTTMENRVEGPTAVFYTTTNPDVDPETKSRFFVTGIDESREQTRKILAFQRDTHRRDDMSRTLQTRAVTQKHITFQRLLKPLGVQNPYSDRLTYTDDRLQGRRDQPKYLNLIKSVAFLRQMQKTTQTNGAGPYVEVDTEDIRIANDLAAEILGRSLDELSRPGRDLLMLLDEMVENLWDGKDKKLKRTDISFTRRDIREYTGWSNTRVHRYLKELSDLEYILVESGRNGSRYRYCLAYEGQGRDGSRFVPGLVPVEQLEGS